MRTLGQEIRELRTELGMSLREFARRLGLSAAYVSDVEHGRRHPSMDVLKRMSAVLNVSVDHLRQYDTRLPIDALRRRADEEPVYGLALRKVAEAGVTAEELLALVERRAADAQRKGER